MTSTADTLESTIPLVVLWVGLAGGVGALIGSSKGKGGVGFLLGLLLGFIGWIIAATLSNTPEKEAEDQAKIAAAQGRTVVPSTSPTAARQWAPDPYGRHNHRYFNGIRWTDKVADAGTESVEPPGYPIPAGPAEGWAPDPFSRFPQRYYRVSGWTNHVTQSGTTYSDPADYPPPDDAPPPPPPVES